MQHITVSMKSKLAFRKLMFIVSEGSVIARPIIDAHCVHVVPKQGKEMWNNSPKCKCFLKKKESTLALLNAILKHKQLKPFLNICYLYEKEKYT